MAPEGKDDTTPSNDRWESGIHTDFSRAMSYGDYLQLDKILDAQEIRSEAHDEMLFVIIHQASELWLKLMIHEIRGAATALTDGKLQAAFKMLARVSRIQSQIIQSWDILSTMTPSDYLTFRDTLGQSSGFQSWQYRSVEFMLGNKNGALVKPHMHDKALSNNLTSILNAPSVYDLALKILAENGLAIDASRLDRDWSKPYEPHESVEAAWVEIYQQPEKYWELYQLAEKLIDVEDWFQQWRFRHMKTVERIIGFKTGTGGTSGVGFLKKALDHRFFPELWSLRTAL
ncbi:MAG: tryptophan 2,3-dioxygenase [Alphaproteobacteria bacterium]|jgi:tryptophan 2,3-dioxygenase|nr:tryptophan 2,3-dioxygenase [Alphaproteobacteria bacterium]MBT4085006.1 tryptophan 2,3-dioxygenase [Alphaproteobacteria bacterium]MBT4545554.1 tryptophan 2,3-dioxygenase [Alphaproteobacteria bacterium]MBT5918463.1 tryptophan 2,3-dioxygenase [Alphaproteobacteria bacterium]MBT7745441.1 tryptophan 2,3-dioxygenase [Alphaproteobacteria bacterium]